MAEPSNHIRGILNHLPEGPGVYQFFDAGGKLIYIGKAKNLKKRVHSYFHKKNFESYKVKVLVNKIHDIQHIVVSSESDALLLENNLIKKHQPRYNILLKDDKTFPWICIKNEPFPRVFSTRKVVRDGSEYFGPYTSAMMVRTLIHLIREIYQLRTCKFQLTNSNIESKKFKVCLEYHIENCQGPCEGLQSESSYMESIEQIRQILKGNLNEVIRFLEKQMQEYAATFRYEEAERIKRKIEILERFRSKSTIVNPSIHNVDVFSIVEDENHAVVNYLNVSKGAVVQVHTVEVQKRLNESAEEILLFAITDLRERVHSSAKEAILPFEPTTRLPWYAVTVPQRGDKKKLLELSQRNARSIQLQRMKREQEPKKSYPADRVMLRLQNDLRLKEKPVHIECFDNSNLQGSHPVASCVVFRNARPLKSEYRHYHIKSVAGANDFASMEEVILRRYRRLLKENQSLPQLVVVDGGKGQLSSAVKSLEALGLRSRIAIIGIAKKLEEIYFPNDPVPLYIDKNSESLRLIQQLRNEAHRFGITFHRQIRSGKMTVSELSNIAGIGAKTIETLFREFKSVDNIRKASNNDLTKLIGASKARIINEHFNLNNR
jgi:excinuclease ABC subunit C